MLDLKLDLLQTLSLAAILLFVGFELRKRIGWVDRLNIPSAVVGGLLFASWSRWWVHPSSTSPTPSSSPSS